MKRVWLSLIGALTLLTVFCGTAQAAGPSTVVIHGVTFTEFFSDDICGPRASTVTFTIDTEVMHVTPLSNGSYIFQDTSHGNYHVDFVDPTLADQNSQTTQALHYALTPGGTEIYSLTFHDFPTGLKIWQRVHLTVVDGAVKVDREIVKVEGCP
jgi:hypothetical protein